MMKKVKRMSAILGIVLFLASITACSNADTAEKDPGTPAAQQSDSTGTTEAVKTLREVELTIFGWDYARVGEDEEGPIYKTMKDKFKVSFKPLTATWNNWEDKLNMYIASGDVPDLLTSYLYDRADAYEKWLREDLLLPLDEYAKDYPNVEKRLKAFDYLKAKEGGKHYGLPIRSQARDVQLQNNHLTWIRKDWLKNLNLNMPTTIEEFYEVAKAFTLNDPDGNKKNDTYGYCTGDDGVYWAYPIFNAFDASLNSWKKDGEQWVPEVISQEMKEAVAFYKKLFSEKILDPEFFTTNYSLKIDKFITGKIGIMTLNAGSWYETYYNDFKKVYPDKNPEDIFTWVPVLKGKNGQQRIDGFDNFFAFTSIHADISDEKKERALMVMDYLLSDEGLSLMRYGLENVHYKKEGDKIVNLIPKGDSEYPVYIGTLDGSAQLKNLVDWDLDFFPEDKPLREAMINTLRENDPYVKSNPLANIFISSSDFSAANFSKMSQFVNDSIVKIVYESKDFEKDWQNFVDGWKSMGGDKFIQVMNKRAGEEGQ